MSEQGAMVVSVTLDPRTAAALTDACQTSGKSVGEVIAAAIAAYEPKPAHKPGAKGEKAG